MTQTHPAIFYGQSVESGVGWAGQVMLTQGSNHPQRGTEYVMELLARHSASPQQAFHNQRIGSPGGATELAGHGYVPQDLDVGRTETDPGFNASSMMSSKVRALERLQRGLANHQSPIQFGRDPVDTQALELVRARVRRFWSRMASDEEDIEGEGGPSEETAKRAVQFVLRASSAFWQRTLQVPPTPAISAGPDASVDVVWQIGDRLVAANIPDEPNNVVTLYGRDRRYPVRRLRAEENPECEVMWFLTWLAQ
jgi:hypothetical protein